MILITNDDGVDAPGLHAAALAAAALDAVVVVAPATPQSVTSRAVALRPGDGSITQEESWPSPRGPIPRYAIRGTPARTVAHAILEVCTQRPRLCVSGINFGANLGGDILLSGTVGAALQAAASGVPALAASAAVGPDEVHWQEDPRRDWEAARAVVQRVIAHIYTHGMPANADVLNLNLPRDVTARTPIRLTRPSRLPVYPFLPPPPRDLEQPFALPVRQAIDWARVEPDSDIAAVLRENACSLTPLSAQLSVPAARWPPL